MIGVRSYGSQIRCGIYQLHSKFNSAANFISGDAFAFIVDSRIGAGPLNIVLEGIKPDLLHSLEVRNDCVYLNDEQFVFDDSTRFNSTIRIEDIDTDKFKANIGIFECALLRHSPLKSLAFLIDDKRKNDFTTSFDLAIVDKFETGLKEILSGNYRTGIEMIKGLGYGLTPSGDDYISGFLIAVHVSHNIFKTDVSSIINVISNSAKGGNIFTNTFLDCAARGHVPEKFQRLIHALCYSEKEDIIYCTQELLTIGATSGTDQAVGFLTAIKRFVQ
jgi:hypothetical protein